MIETIALHEQSARERHLQEEMGVDFVKISRLFRTSEPLPKELQKELFTDGLTESLVESFSVPESDWMIEVALKPGVTDNLARTAEIAIADRTGKQLSLKSAHRYYIRSTLSKEEVERLALDHLANPMIEEVVVRRAQEVEVIPLPADDEALFEVSRDRQLALNLEEMQAIRAHYASSGVQEERRRRNLPLDPTDVELECLAQTWSEHCKHKIFNAAILYEGERVDSIFKTYIQGSTKELAPQTPWVVSVFSDNAGIIELTKEVHLAFKAETHNSPSALDPYGGALTGILGVMRDAMGCGIGARLVASTNVFCFADPDYKGELPPRLMHPKRILRGVRRGVEDGGNKMGVPTVNGSLVFDERYLGKPLVYCGSVGLLPAEINGRPTYEKKIAEGDLVVVAGGRTGRDGIHGATFSSEALTEASPTSAVQIGDPFTQKKTHDFLLEARDKGLIRTLTDNGAGGLSSSVGEMAELSSGAIIDLSLVPLKEEGLLPWEILLSESQERMTLAVDQQNFEALQEVAARHEVEITSIGRFTGCGAFEVRAGEQVVAHLPLDFLHDGLPQMELEATLSNPVWRPASEIPEPNDLGETLKALLSRPNICSKEGVVRQYDHEVQAQTLLKPLCGPTGEGPANAAIVQPLEVQGSSVGFAIGHGICPRYSDLDAAEMTACAIDEALRNVVAVGGNPDHCALLDNYCWPDPVGEQHTTAQLVESCRRLYEVTKELGTPLISGKDSMKNDYRMGGTKISVPPTLLVSALAKVDDIHRGVTMEAKQVGDKVFLLGITREALGASEYATMQGEPLAGTVPRHDAPLAKSIFRALHAAIQTGQVHSCHDLSDGGLAVALAEKAFSGNLGIDCDLAQIPHEGELTAVERLFSESPTRFLLSGPATLLEQFDGLPIACIGEVVPTQKLRIRQGDQELLQEPLSTLKSAWQSNPELGPYHG